MVQMGAYCRNLTAIDFWFKLLKRGLNARILKSLSQPLVDRGGSLLPASAESLVAITEFVEPDSLAKLGAEVSASLNQEWTGSETISLCRLLQMTLPPIDALHVLDEVSQRSKFTKEQDLLEFNQIKSLVYSDCGQLAQSLELLEDLLARQLNQDQVDEVKVAANLAYIGKTLREQGDYARAISRYEECLEMRKKALGDSHPNVAATIAMIGCVLRRQGDYVGALSNYGKCLAIRKKAWGESHPKVAATSKLIAIVLRDQGE